MAKTREELLADVAAAQRDYDIVFFGRHLMGDEGFARLQECSRILINAEMAAKTTDEKIAALRVEAQSYLDRAEPLLGVAVEFQLKSEMRTARGEHGLGADFMSQSVGALRAAKALQGMAQQCLDRIADLQKENSEVAA